MAIMAQTECGPAARAPEQATRGNPYFCTITVAAGCQPAPCCNNFKLSACTLLVYRCSHCGLSARTPVRCRLPACTLVCAILSTPVSTTVCTIVATAASSPHSVGWQHVCTILYDYNHAWALALSHCCHQPAPGCLQHYAGTRVCTIIGIVGCQPAPLFVRLGATAGCAPHSGDKGCGPTARAGSPQQR